MPSRRFVICLLVALLALIPGSGGAQDSWLDGAREGWNTPGGAVPTPPSFATESEVCRHLVRPPETDEDQAVAAQGWLLLPSYEGGWGITLVGGFVGFDAMCRPVYFQQFAFVDGEFAGTLSPEPMTPRSDGALTEAGIGAADRLYAVYARYAATDPLCCPSRETTVTFAIERTTAGPVVRPDADRNVATPAAATTAVCVILGTGGDDLSLVSLTEEEIAAYEASTRPVATPHPGTGTCTDPAGLPVLRDFLGGFSWVCLQTAVGDWYGPSWTAAIYLPKNAVPPDPAIGGCPFPRDESIPPPSESQQAAATAVYLSQLEAAGEFDTLYTWLHPDAQAVIPKEAVVGWYTADVLPRGPEPISVTSVDFGEWTWPVTGTSYPRTAEIAYEQRFADGSVERDVMRLVQDDQGSWRWFFGRDRTFVDEQIARYDGQEPGEANGAGEEGSTP